MVDLKIFIDLDGTIAGSSERKSVWWSTYQLFKTGLKFDLPNKIWSILAARPKIEKSIINMACIRYGLKPESIITSQSWFYEFKNIEEICNWKNSILSNALDESKLLEKYILYIDNNPDVRSRIITQKNMFVCSPEIAVETINDISSGRICNGFK